MQERLSEHRFKHTLSVRDTALKILDTNLEQLSLENQKQIISKESFVEKLETASLLHDSCKELKNEELLKLANFYGIKIYPEDEASPNLLHARVGAKWVEDEFEIIDPYIIKAIEEHTLGGEEMFLSSNILFLSDMIEPQRKASKDLEEIREQVYSNNDLDASLFFAMNKKIIHILEKGHRLHPLAIQARNNLIA